MKITLNLHPANIFKRVILDVECSICYHLVLLLGKKVGAALEVQDSFTDGKVRMELQTSPVETCF